ncbi:MAG: hypothetical protein HY278_06090 [candidate division NC10 bacterium]|nr:hypothetical protein [candidate division NC10 bacterium]
MRQTVAVIIGQVIDLVSALVDLLLTSMISLPAPAFIGIALVTFLLGLLLGRISKRNIPEAVENSEGKEEDRVVLDLEKLTPLGLSTEEEAETEAMDLSALRPEETTERTASSDRWDRLQQGTAPERQ